MWRWSGLACGVIILSITSCWDTKKGGDEASQQPLESSQGVDISERIIEDPNNGDLYIERSKQLQQQEDYTAALNDIDRAIKLDSNNSQYYTERGRLLYSIGKVGSAKFALEKSINLDENNVDAKLTLAELLLVLTNHDKSMSLINDVLRIDDQLPKPYFLKGLIYREQGNVKLAKSSLQTVTELDPDHVEAFNLLGMTYAEEGDSLALQYYESALVIDSTSREVLYNRAHFYQTQMRPGESLAAYDDLLRAHPNTAGAHFNKGYVYLGLLSSAEEAVNSFTEAIRCDPNYYQAYTNRGLALEELGRVELAIKDYELAVELEPNFEPAIQGLNRLN